MRFYIQWFWGRAWNPVFYYLLCFLIKIIAFLCMYMYVCMSWCTCVGQTTPCGFQFFLLPPGAWGSRLGCQVRAWCWSRGQQHDRACAVVLWFSRDRQCFIFLILIACKLTIQRNNWVLYKLLWLQNAAQRGNTPVDAPPDIKTPPLKKAMKRFYW